MPRNVTISAPVILKPGFPAGSVVATYRCHLVPAATNPALAPSPPIDQDLAAAMVAAAPAPPKVSYNFPTLAEGSYGGEIQTLNAAAQILDRIPIPAFVVQAPLPAPAPATVVLMVPGLPVTITIT